MIIKGKLHKVSSIQTKEKEKANCLNKPKSGDNSFGPSLCEIAIF